MTRLSIATDLFACLRRLFTGGYYSVVNICKYRTLGDLPPNFFTRMNGCNNIVEMQQLLSEGLLYAAGLRLATECELTAPAWVWLTKCQRSIVAKVERHGYRVAIGRNEDLWRAS